MGERDTSGHTTATFGVVADFLEAIELAAGLGGDLPELLELRKRAPGLIEVFRAAPERFVGSDVDPELWAELRELVDLAGIVRVRLGS